MGIQSNGLTDAQLRALPVDVAIDPIVRNFYAAAIGPYTAYATPTDLLMLTNPAASGRVIMLRTLSINVTATAAGRMLFFFGRRTVANTGGASTAPTPYKVLTTAPNPIGVLTLYSAAPTIDGSAQNLGSSDIITGTSTTVDGIASMSNLHCAANQFIQNNNYNFPLLEGQSIALNLAGAALPAGFTSGLSIAWEEIEL